MKSVFYILYCNFFFIKVILDFFFNAYRVIKKLILYLLNLVGNYIYVSKCGVCKEVTEGIESILCIKCWKKLEFITQCCSVCSKPWEVGISNLYECLVCIKTKPKCKSKVLLKFNVTSKTLIHSFKYYDMTHYGKYFAKLICAHLLSDVEYDVIIPTPIPLIRRITRMYNQIEVLGRYISGMSGTLMYSDVLFKTKFTKQQSMLSKKDRKRNLIGSFGVKNKQMIKGKRIVLLDDVITTGTTVKLCSEELMKHGAKSVLIVAIART